MALTGAALASVLLVAGCGEAPGGAGEAAVADEARLNEADRELLRGLIEGVLTDPAGRRYVRVQRRVHGVMGGASAVGVAGWADGPEGEPPDRVYFLDGDWIEASDRFEEIDFIEESRRRLRDEPPQPAGEESPEAMMRRHQHQAVPLTAPAPPLVRAAWLWRLGEERLAARTLRIARNHHDPDDDRPRFHDPAHTVDPEMLRRDLAWRAFASAVHAFMARDDGDALDHVERLLRLYPEHAETFGEAAALRGDLERRRERGIFAAPAPKMPDDFDERPVEDRADWLVERLDEVEARQPGQPASIDWNRDPLFAALLEIGDPAVPALIERVERDDRLTRSVGYARDFGRRRELVDVRQVAALAASEILRLDHLPVLRAVRRGDHAGAADRLRTYWERYGGLDVMERMMAKLTDPGSDAATLHRAAVTLATPHRRTAGSEHPFEGYFHRGDRPKVHPAVERFDDPTAAEAVLDALDRRIVEHAGAGLGGDWRGEDRRRQRTEETFLRVLVELGDRRVTPELRMRFDGPAVTGADRPVAPEVARRYLASRRAGAERRVWAAALFALGDPEPLDDLADDLRAGDIELPPPYIEPEVPGDPTPREIELGAIVRAMAEARTDAANAALHALAEPDHPLHEMVVEDVRRAAGRHRDQRAWFGHAYCITILRRDLDDTSPSGTTYHVLEGRRYEARTGHSRRGDPLPDGLEDLPPGTTVTERRADRAATALGRLVHGLPDYSPLMPDDQAIDRMRHFLDRAGPLRRIDGEERERLGGSRWQPIYVPEASDRAA